MFEISTDHTQNIGIFGETAGGTLKKIISYLELVSSGKSMVTVNLAQNAPITKVMRKIPLGPTKTDFCCLMSCIFLEVVCKIQSISFSLKKNVKA